ncbi:MAG TPA: hypothetical protein VK539_22995 [Myxococcaceae bacterium]|nr:hypothetical protein [Myxococcaceae bacterium]
MKGSYLPAVRMFYLATLGAEADFIVLDPRATPLLGDDRAVMATYAAGVKVHERHPS